MHKKPLPALLLFLSVFNLTMIGCGPSQGDLGGTVSYKGKSVVRGSVLVVGTDRVPKQGPINPDGTYLVKDITAGAVKIAVISPQPTAKVARKKDEAPEKADTTGWFRLPENYSDPEKSSHSFQLKSGSNSHNIELK